MSSSITSGKSRVHFALASGFWLLVWQFGSTALAQEILLPSPLTVLQTLASLLGKTAFWHTVGFSMLRITAGFLLALTLGAVLAGLSARLQWVRILLTPLVRLMNATPVATFIILVLLWVKSANIAFPISFLMVFPILYTGILSGIDAANPKLLEMGQVFSLSPMRRILYLYLPDAMPFLISGCQVGLGICWKSGVAAEVIGQSSATIGGNLYTAKLYLETAEMFAWTVVVIIVSAVSERIFLHLLERAQRHIDRGNQR